MWELIEVGGLLMRLLKVIIAFGLLQCFPAIATIDDVWNSTPPTNDGLWAHQNSLPMQPSQGSGGDAIFYTISAGYGQTQTKQLVSVSAYHCAISISQSRNDNHVNTEVYQSGGYWFLRLYSVGNAGAVNGGAVCWPK